MTLHGLLARCEAATGSDRDLDGEIALLSGWTFSKKPEDSKPYWREPGIADWWYRHKEGPPTYTSRLNAAVDLVERLLPGWSWEVGRGGSTLVYAKIDMDGHLSCDADGPTPALALVCALLRCLMNIEEACTSDTGTGGGT